MPDTPTTKEHQKLLEELGHATDQELLRWVTDGKPMFDLNGNPVRDDSGAIVMRPLSGAEMSAVIRRLKDCGVTTPATGESLPEQIARRMAGGGGPRPALKIAGLPPVSDDEDAAVA